MHYDWRGKQFDILGEGKATRVRIEFAMFYELLQYELHAAERYRRFVSVVMITADDNPTGLPNLLGDHVRRSDVMSDFDSSLAILMGETDKGDALTAVKRYGNLFDDQIDLRFSVVTYPGDGANPYSLVQTAYRRLNKAKTSQKGSVVAVD
jgi:hypothetical protein